MDTRPYLAAPFAAGGRTPAAWDCWGCVRWISEHEFGRPLPEYPGAGVHDSEIDQRDLLRVIRERVAEFQKVDDPAPGDIVLLRTRQRPLHVGIVVDTQPLMMMHAEASIDTAVERLHTSMWRHRIEGYYRYAGW